LAVDYFTHDLILILSNVLDVFGAVIIALGSVIPFLRYFRKLLLPEESLRLNLAKTLALGLEFKLGGEILRTVVVRTINEIMVLAAIVVIRAMISLLIHWEINQCHDCAGKEK
jgi:uncharacterized membrane protein